MSETENNDRTPRLRLVEGGTEDQVAASKGDPLRLQFQPAAAARDGEKVERGPQPLPHIMRLPQMRPEDF